MTIANVTGQGTVDFDFLERQPVHGRPGQPTRVEYWRTGGTVAPD